MYHVANRFSVKSTFLDIFTLNQSTKGDRRKVLLRRFLNVSLEHLTFPLCSSIHPLVTSTYSSYDRLQH